LYQISAPAGVLLEHSSDLQLLEETLWQMGQNHLEQTQDQAHNKKERAPIL